MILSEQNQQRIAVILDEILNSIALRELHHIPFSLITPKGSGILFCAHYYLATQNEAAGNLAIDLLNESMDEVSRLSTDGSLANGIVGFGWLLQHLANIGFLSPEDTVGLEEMDGMIEASLEEDFRSGNYDLLYGFIGKGIYFLERPRSPTTIRVLETIAAMLEALAVPVQNDQVAWNNLLEQRDAAVESPNYLLGLAHGQASIIAFLTLVYHRGIASDVVKPLLQKACSWMLAQALQSDQISVFPTNAANPEYSRLAWCQGDLGIALALGNAQAILNDEALGRTIVRLDQSLIKRTLVNSNVNANVSSQQLDTTLCHGTSGVLHLLNRLNHSNGHTDSLQQWLSITLDQIELTRKRTRTGIETLTWTGHELGYVWKEDYGLTQGVFGTALILLELLHPTAANWDIIILTSAATTNR